MTVLGQSADIDFKLYIYYKDSDTGPTRTRCSSQKRVEWTPTADGYTFDAYCTGLLTPQEVKTISAVTIQEALDSYDH